MRENADDADRRRDRLMAAAQHGDRQAYALLLRECARDIEHIARRCGVGPHALDDVVQDVLLTVHRVRHTYEPGRPFDAWLAAIAKRRAIDHLRQRGRRSREMHVPTAYDSHPDPAPTPAQESEARSEHRALHRAIGELPEAQRRAVQALAIGELSLDAAARLTGVSGGALKVGLHRAIKSLRVRLASEG